MISAWEVYWIMRLDGISFIAAAMILCGFLVSAIFIVAYFVNNSEATDHSNSDNRKARHASLAALCKKWATRSFAVLSIGLFIGTFVPDTKQAAVIYLLPKIANNEQVQKMPENFVKLLNTKMEAWIANFEKDKKEKK